jgi:GNAT superfamily N-acetyltransferase
VAVTVRVAGVDDQPTLVALRLAWNEEDAGAPIDDDEAEGRLLAWFADEWATRTFFLVEDDGDPVGMANVKRYVRMPVAGRPDAGHWGYVGNVFVLADRRDAGVGRVLMDALVAWCTERRYERLRLAPSERARPFYARLGFVPGQVIQLDPPTR